MQLVFVTPVVPVATQPRPHHLIRGLASVGHDVHVVALADSSRTGATEDDPSWRRLVDAARSVRLVDEPAWRCVARAVAAVPTPTPLQVAYCRSPRLREALAAVVRRTSPDLLYVDRARISFLADAHGPPRVLDATDAMTLHYRRSRATGALYDRAIAWIELPRMRRYEARMTAPYAATLATTRADADALRELGAGDVTVLPNGVDPSLLDLERRPEPDRLLFLGNMDYGPNVDAVAWFAEVVLPLLWRGRPDLRLVIVGDRPRPVVERLGDDPRITVTGWVPDLRSYLARAAVFVAPLRIGGGFPNKVAQALAAGIPVVSTTAGHAGIGGLVPGEHLLAGDDAETFAAQVEAVLADPEAAAAIGSAGRRFVAETHTWPQVVRRLDDLLRDSAGRARG